MKPEKHTFQAEVGNILDIVAHSLYSQKEVFLRDVFLKKVFLIITRSLL